MFPTVSHNGNNTAYRGPQINRDDPLPRRWPPLWSSVGFSPSYHRPSRTHVLEFFEATALAGSLPLSYLNMFRRKEVSVVWPGNLSCDFFFFLLTLKFVTSVIIKILNLVNNSNYQQVVILGYWMNIVHKVPQNSQNNFFKWISVFKGTAACRIERYIKHEAFPLGAASV